MKILKTVLAAAVVATLAMITAPAANAADMFALDKPHSQIGFSISRLGYTNIRGWFRKFNGEVMFDQGNVANSKVSATMMTESIDTGFARRDKHLRSPDFFNAKEFPEMKFVSTKIEKTGSNTGKMTGNLTLLGVTKPVTLDVKFNKLAPHPRNKRVFAGFTATGQIDRTAWGMKFLSPGVSPKVDIHIEALTQKK